MVTADNLNLDVLEIIFSHLPHQDLASTALVSRSFFVGVIPRLYRKITYGLKHGKRYPRVVSPFGVVVAHPWLAKYVKHIDIRFVPKIQTQYHSKFLSECTKTVQAAQNLLTFKCSKPILPLFLVPLRGKRGLEELQVNANLTTAQSILLSELENISSLSLDAGSWNVIDMLPKWAPKFHSTLRHLTLYMSNEVNEIVLEQLLPQLPKLVGLHIIGCPKVDHLAVMRLVSHVPLLESLSFSTTESSQSFTSLPPHLPRLKHLSVDSRLSMIASPLPGALPSILDRLRPSHPPLESFIMKFQDVKIIVGQGFIEQLVKDYAFTLTQMSFVECALGMESIIHICQRCPHLERLELPIPFKELIPFTAAVGRSSTISTIVNTNRHTGHEPQQTLDTRNVKYLMTNVLKLDTIISDKRIWMVIRQILTSYCPRIDCIVRGKRLATR
ncbi:hypothetical protein L218DRAFT_1051357 [Marasmius fiardii PR-910]|nr:hypothetical protein L218DRAFT_1051357 [Marasmius fiardii PR-910]